jgi:hypothetical protein
MKTIEIEQLAVMFRNAPAAPQHSGVDTWNAMAEIGGRAAILYGMFLATPFRQRWKKRDLGLGVADALDLQARTATSRAPAHTSAKI